MFEEYKVYFLQRLSTAARNIRDIRLASLNVLGTPWEDYTV